MKWIARAITGVLTVGLLITLAQIFPSGFLGLWLLNSFRLGVTVAILLGIWFLIKKL